MQPLQYDLQSSAAKDNSITQAAAARSNLDAAIAMRFAASRRKPARIYTLHTQHHMTTVMQPFQCDPQPEIPKHPITTHTQADPKQLQATISLRHHCPSSPLPIVTTSHCSPPPFLTTPRHHHFPPSPLPFHTTSHRPQLPSSPLPFITTSLRHHFPSSPLPIVTTSHRPHLPSSPPPFITTSLPHHFPSTPLPIVPNSFPHHSPSSPLPSVTTSLHHHFPSSPPPIVTTSHRHHLPSSPPPSSPLPFLTTSLPHQSPSSPLLSVTTSLRHHSPSSPLPFVTTSLQHHFPSPPSCLIASHSFVIYCYCIVMWCTTLHHSQFHQVKVIRNSEVLLPNFLWYLFQLLCNVGFVLFRIVAKIT